MINETSDSLSLNTNNKSEPQEIRVKNCLLSIEGKKIRSDWLRSLYTLLLGNIGIDFGNYVFLALYLNMEAANEALNIGLLVLMSLCIALTIVYVFAYRGFGTKWIGFNLILSPIQYSFALFKSLVEVFSQPDIPMISIVYVFSIHFFSISFFAYFWINCLKLYRLNSSVNKKKVHA